jgi:hypothetical protein
MANKDSDARDREIMEAFCQFYIRAKGVSAILLDTPDARQPGKGLPDGLIQLDGVECDVEVGGCNNYEGQREDIGRVGHIRARLGPHFKMRFPQLTIYFCIHGGSIPNDIDYQALCEEASKMIECLKPEFEVYHKLIKFPFFEVGVQKMVSDIEPFHSFILLARDRTKNPLIQEVRTFLEAKERQHKRRREEGRINKTVLLVDLWDMYLSNYRQFAMAYAGIVRDGLQLPNIHEIWLVYYNGQAYCNPIKIGKRQFDGTLESLPEFQDMNQFNK